MVTAHIVTNPLRAEYDQPEISSEVVEFHQRMPAYGPTPLFDVPELAAELGVGRLLVKAETWRMGLPSFKILGASWATYCALRDHIGHEPEPWRNISELAASLAHLRPFRLVTATDGNHGRAVAFMARLLGFDCDVFVPIGTVQARIEAIQREGASVTVVNGSYDDAVAESAKEASAECVVVSDTSWDGYEDIPGRVIEGYNTIFQETADALSSSGSRAPDVVVIPMGVGALMAAATTFHRRDDGGTAIVGVEPLTAACVQESMIAGEIRHIPGPHNSIMAGLNCGTPSLVAWPRVSAGVDWSVSISDSSACVAMKHLAEVGIVAGETGAAALAGFVELSRDDSWKREMKNLDDATVLLIVTEGATDPAKYREIVGRDHEHVGRVTTAVTPAYA